MKRLALLFCLSAVAGLCSETWKPIPKEVWAIKDGAQGAVVLEESVRYGLGDSEYHMRIRIFRESGKAAASLQPFGSRLKFVTGRTVYPDGKVLAFDDQKDFATRESKVGYSDRSETVVVPPGLTDDCVVDLHWGEKYSPLGGGYLYYERHLLRPFPIQKLELRLNMTGVMDTRLLDLGTHLPQTGNDGDYRVYTFQNLPALEPVPFAVNAARENPSLFCFEQPFELRDAARKGADAYWKEACEKIYKTTYSRRLQGGNSYRKFADQILQNLPKDPLEKAQEIMLRIDQNILNVSALTYEELAHRTKAQSEERIDTFDLDEAVERRWTSSVGIFNLAFKLFCDAGLHPKMLLAADRDVRPFRFQLLSTDQITEHLIGLEGADKKGIGIVDPGRRFLPPGIVNPDFQGTSALEVDSSDWTFKQVKIPPQPSMVNQRQYRVDISLDGENETFKTSAQYAGYPEYLERTRYMALEPKEQGKKLKETLGSSLKSYAVSRAEVLHAQDPKLNLSWEAEGSRELDAPSRHTIWPFPGMTDPLPIPSTWPEKRSEVIVIPYCRIHSALSRIRIPKGWKATVDPDLREENGFGKVTWVSRTVQEGEDRVLEIRYIVDASRMFGPASEYESLKTFIGWMEKGAQRKVVLFKER